MLCMDYTMELICETLRMLREEYHFRGYIHCKAIPGANPMLVEYAGWYADPDPVSGLPRR